MKLQKNVFASLLLLALVVVGFASCSDDDNKSESNNSVLSNVYVLSSGKQGSNTAVLLNYNPETGKTSNLFEAANGVKLGDTGQDMISYGNKIYVAVYGSKKIYVLDKTGKKLGEITGDEAIFTPRMLEAYNGKVYVTLFSGHVARIDTTSLQVDKTIAVGLNPEYLKVVRNKLYVANSGGMNYQNGYDNRVSVLDIDLTKREDIEVAVNPVELQVDKYNNLYLVSRGNYKTVPNTLQSINTTTNEVKVLATDRSFSIYTVSNRLYMLDKRYDANYKPTSNFLYWDIPAQKIVEQSFITDEYANKLPDVYFVTVEPKSGNFYVTVANGSNNGDVYIFSPGGKFISKFDTGSAYPVKVIFVYK